MLELPDDLSVHLFVDSLYNKFLALRYTLPQQVQQISKDRLCCSLYQSGRMPAALPFPALSGDRVKPSGTLNLSWLPRKNLFRGVKLNSSCRPRPRL